MKQTSSHQRLFFFFFYLYTFVASIFTPFGVWEHVLSHLSSTIVLKSQEATKAVTHDKHETKQTESLCLVCENSLVFQLTPFHYAIFTCLYHSKSFFIKRTDYSAKKLLQQVYYAARAPPISFHHT